MRSGSVLSQGGRHGHIALQQGYRKGFGCSSGRSSSIYSTGANFGTPNAVVYLEHRESVPNRGRDHFKCVPLLLTKPARNRNQQDTERGRYPGSLRQDTSPRHPLASSANRKVIPVFGVFRSEQSRSACTIGFTKMMYLTIFSRLRCPRAGREGAVRNDRQTKHRTGVCSFAGR